MLTRMMIWMERERERGHPLHVARKRRDETLKAMNNHHAAVVEEIRLRDLHPSDKDLSTSSCAGLSIDRIRGEGDATAWTQGLDLGTSPHIINCEETGKCSRRRLEKEQEKQVQREASDGAKIVEGPVQAEAAVAAESESEGAAVASSWKPRWDKIGGRSAV